MDINILLFIFFACVIVIAIFVLSNFRFVSVKPNINKNNRAEYFATKFNNKSSEFSELVNQYSYLLNEKHRQVILNNDAITMGQLNNFTDEFNAYCNNCEDYLKRGRNCFEAQDYVGMEYCLNSINDELEEMKTIYDYVSQIEINDCNHFGNPLFGNQRGNNNSSGAKNLEPNIACKSMGFFNGCKSMEEIDTRYKSLAKALHPDAKAGNSEMFKQLKAEYDEIKTKGGI